MGIEIERKFLLKNDSWKGSIHESKRIQRGYLTDLKGKSSVRIQTVMSTQISISKAWSWRLRQEI